MNTFESTIKSMFESNIILWFDLSTKKYELN